MTEDKPRFDFTDFKLWPPGRKKPIIPFRSSRMTVHWTGEIPLRNRDKKSPEEISLEEVYKAWCFDDPSEWSFMTEGFGAPDTWKYLRSMTRIKHWVRKWQEDLNIERQSRAWKEFLKNINKPSVAKYLIEHVIEEGEPVRTVETKRNRNVKTKNVVKPKVEDLPDNVIEILKEKKIQLQKPR